MGVPTVIARITPLPLPIAVLITGGVLLVGLGIVAAIADARHRRRSKT